MNPCEGAQGRVLVSVAGAVFGGVGETPLCALYVKFRRWRINHESSTGLVESSIGIAQSGTGVAPRSTL